MSESSLKEIKFKIYDVNSFKYPKYSIIKGIKITNLKIVSKIISKNNILVYGLVSYTHLDVYKRQAHIILNIPLNLPLLSSRT